MPARVILGFISRVIEAEADDGGDKRREFDPDIGQAVKNQVELNQ